MNNYQGISSLCAVFLVLIVHSADIDASALVMAGVTFNEKTVSKAVKSKAIGNLEKRRKYQQWHELQGYLNNQYVYLIVKRNGEKDIKGYLFDNGERKYIYGEWFDRRLIIYDQTNNRLNILLQ